MEGTFFKEFQGIFHGHIQDIINALSLVFYLQCFTVITLSAADFTWHIYIRKEVHLDLNDTIAGAGFAPAAFLR